MSIDGLKAYYKFDEASGDIINHATSIGSSDSITTSDLTVNGMTYVASGTSPFGYEGSFDGSNDDVAPDSTSISDWGFINKTGAVFTFIFWYNKNSAFSAIQDMFGMTNYNAGDSGIFLRWNTDRTARIALGKNGTDFIDYTTTMTTPNDSNWHMIMVQYDDSSGTLKISIDNNTPESSTGHNLTATTNAENVFNMGWNSVGTWANIKLAEVSIWNRILTTSEITSLYNSGNGLEIRPSKPTNVQDNSILVEKDTAKRYWSSGYFPSATVTRSDDFSSDGWTDNDSTYIGVSGGSMNWNCKRDGSNDASVYDLTSTSANWILRFKLTVTNVSSSTQAGNGFYVGLSDSIQTAGQSTSQDFIGVSIYNDNTDTYRTIDADGSALPAIYQGDSYQATTYNTGSIWYYEIIKTGSSYTVEAFSGSDYSTGSEGKITGSSSATGLRYLKVLNDMASIPTSTNPFQGTINALKFYDGVTNVGSPATWTNPKIKTALTIDTVNYETIQSTASSRSLSFTVNAETDQHKMLIVGISGGGASLTVTGVTYAGVSMTALATGGSGSPYYSEYRLFYLLDPPTGTANITATQSTGTNMSISFGLSVYGAKQSAPVAVGSGRYATPNTLTQSITASVSGSWIVSSITGGTVNNASPPSNYYTVAELETLNLGTASYQQNGLDKTPTIGSASAPSFNYKHPANNNAQPVGMFSLVLEPYG